MKKFTIFILFLTSSSLLAQERYIVFFKDKNNTNYESYKDNLKSILSPEAIAKKKQKNIPIDKYDMPLDSRKIDLLKKNDCKIIRQSKWLNAVLIETSRTQEEILTMTDIKNIVYCSAKKSSQVSNKFNLERKEANSSLKQNSTIDYGVARTQNELLNIDHLHNLGYTGEDVTIAVFDAGFRAVNFSIYFDSLNSNNQIIATYDFVNDTSYVYSVDDHGSYALSLIAANQPEEFVGMAPSANFLLAITDDFYSETHQDEFNWVAAMEWADSTGVDIISSSVSYSKFDSGQGDYNYDDLDGNTSIIAKGAGIAASKGLIVVNSGGNGGKITTPCDADSILCVGGTDSLKNYDSISSTGPTFDGRIKPDISAQTIDIWGVKVVNLSTHYIGRYSYGGTSGSTPMISGLAACLKSAHPDRTNMEIITAIKLSAHQANNPDTLVGYGVPNARVADSILTNFTSYNLAHDTVDNNKYIIYPNPFSEDFHIQTADKSLIKKVEIYSTVGQLVKRQFVDNHQLLILTHDLPCQAYFIKITNAENYIIVKRVMKN